MTVLPRLFSSVNSLPTVALVRRSHLASESVLTAAALKLDRVQRHVERSGRGMELTAKSFRSRIPAIERRTQTDSLHSVSTSVYVSLISRLIAPAACNPGFQSEDICST